MRNRTIKQFLCNIRLTTKATLKENRKLLFLSLACCLLGFLFSLFRSADHHAVSVLEKIVNKDFSIFLFEIKILFYLITPSLLCFLLSINYFVLFLTFGEIIAGSFLLFRYALACIACHFLFGSLALLFLLLPILFIVVIGLTILFHSLSDIIRYPACSKIIHIIPYYMFFDAKKKTIVSYLLFTALPCFVYGNFFVVVAYLICGA